MTGSCSLENVKVMKGKKVEELSQIKGNQRNMKINIIYAPTLEGRKMLQRT